MKQLLILLALVYSSSSFAMCADILIDKFVPRIQGTSTFLCKNFFVIIYDTANKRPVVTIEKLTAETVKNSTLPRKGIFKPDPIVDSNAQPNLKYFVGSGFDLGHLVPYEDMAFNASAADNTMVLTNVVPQFANHNRGIWKALEGRARKLTRNGTIYVFTGPVYSKVQTVFPDNTPIPAALFKVIVNPATKESYCYLIPNLVTVQTENLGKYSCKINDIVKKTPIIRLFPINLKLTEKTGL